MSAVGSSFQFSTKRYHDAISDGGDSDEDGSGGAGTGKGDRVVKHPNKRNATSTGRRKVDIQYLHDKSKRSVTFAKRRNGLMKKAWELSTLTGTQALVLLVSETGIIYSFTTSETKQIIESQEGQTLIRASLANRQATSTASTSEQQHSFTFDNNGQAVFNPQDQQGNIPVYAPLSNVPLEETRQHSSADQGAQLPLSSSSAVAAPLPSYSTSGYSQPLAPQTPYERANLEFARKSNYGFGSSMPSASNGRSNGQHAVNLDPELQGIAVSAAPLSAEENETRKRTSQEASKALVDAYARSTIASFTSAYVHFLHDSAASSSSSYPPTLFQTIESFRRSCEQHRFILPDQLPVATREFFDKYLPANNATKQFKSESQDGLKGFFEWIRGKNLISDVLADCLVSLVTCAGVMQAAGGAGLAGTSSGVGGGGGNEASSGGYALLSLSGTMENSSFATGRPRNPSRMSGTMVGDGAERAELITRQWKAWVDRSKGVYDKLGETKVTEGAWDVYRVRKNFALIKWASEDARPGPQEGQPIKLRIPHSLAPKLRIDDVLYLSIRRVPGRAYFVPVSFASLDPTDQPDATESDIDPLTYRKEIDRLLSLPGGELGNEVEEAVNFNQSVVRQMERAREMLEQGELSEDGLD